MKKTQMMRGLAAVSLVLAVACSKDLTVTGPEQQAPPQQVTVAPAPAQPATPPPAAAPGQPEPSYRGEISADGHSAWVKNQTNQLAYARLVAYYGSYDLSTVLEASSTVQVEPGQTVQLSIGAAFRCEVQVDLYVSTSSMINPANPAPAENIYWRFFNLGVRCGGPTPEPSPEPTPTPQPTPSPNPSPSPSPSPSPEPEVGICYYNVPGNDGEEQCIATPGFVSWEEQNHLCGLTFPGIADDNFNLNPGQSVEGCLRKQDQE